MKVEIIIPAYKNPTMTRECLESIHANLAELDGHAVRVVVINDAPTDVESSTALQEAVDTKLIHELVTNKANIGFVRTVNKGLDLARKRGAAALIVNTDTVCFPGALREMFEVLASDGQIGFVCPRSNNAALATLPSFPHGLSGLPASPARGHAAWAAVAPLLPKWNFVPTCVGFFLLVAPQVVADFGWLSEEFGIGYEEENDLVMRAGKVGFRGAHANHAYVHHYGSASFALHEDVDVGSQKAKNLERIMGIHPEFLPSVRRYEATPHFRAERLMGTLVPTARGKRRVAFYLAEIGPYHNGTNEAACAVLSSLDAVKSSDLELTIICQRAAALFHGFDKYKNIRWTERVDGRYAVVLSLGQPFDLHMINIMEMLAPINVYGMLDTIAIDCAALSYDKPTEMLWRHVAEVANGLFFISQYSHDTFANRFRDFKARHYTRLFPTRLTEYRTDESDQPEFSRDHVLVIGNHFDHKDAVRSARQLAEELPGTAITVLGNGKPLGPTIRSLRAGELDDQLMRSVFEAASVVVIPSYYEGFGLNLPKTIALGKPIVARDIPATREILARYEGLSGVQLYSTNAELTAAVKLAVENEASSATDIESADSWSSWSIGLIDFIRTLIDAPNLFETLVARIERGDFMRSAHQDGWKGYDTSTQPVLAARPTVAEGIQSLLDLTNVEFASEVYLQILGRPPDPLGLSNLITALDGGASRLSVIGNLVDSEELHFQISRL